MKILSMPSGGLSGNYIFNNGVMYVGLAAYPYKQAGTGTAGDSYGTLTIENDKLVITRSGHSGTTSVMSDEIDVTDLSGITLNIESTGNANYFRAFLTQSGLVNNYVGVSETPLTVGICTINCAALTGNYRLAIEVVTGSGTYTPTIVSIKKNSI